MRNKNLQLIVLFNVHQQIVPLRLGENNMHAKAQGRSKKIYSLLTTHYSQFPDIIPYL